MTDGGEDDFEHRLDFRFTEGIRSFDNGEGNLGKCRLDRMYHEWQAKEYRSYDQPLKTKCQPDSMFGEKTSDCRCRAKCEEEIKSQDRWREDERHRDNRLDDAFESYFAKDQKRGKGDSDDKQYPGCNACKFKGQTASWLKIQIPLRSLKSEISDGCTIQLISLPSTMSSSSNVRVGTNAVIVVS